jgi:hypothetical protein
MSLTPLQHQLCEHWRALTQAAQERAEEIARVERHLAALVQAHATLRRQAEALSAFMQTCDLREPSAEESV